MMTIACVPMVLESMRAAIILKKDYQLESRIINIHTLKPLDTETINQSCDRYWRYRDL